MKPGRRTATGPTPSAAPAAAFSRPRARVPGARGPARPEPRPRRGLPDGALTVRTSCPAAPASPSSGPPRSAPPGPRGCSASPVAPMAPPAPTTPAQLCHRPESGPVTSLERAAHRPGSGTRRAAGLPGEPNRCVSSGTRRSGAVWVAGLPPGSGRASDVHFSQGSFCGRSKALGEVRGRRRGEGFHPLGLRSGGERLVSLHQQLSSKTRF